MKINTQQVRDSAVYIRDTQAQLEQIKNSVVQVRNRLDQRVVIRSGVNAMLNQSVSGLDQIRNRLQAIDSFLTDSATLYEMNETQLQKKVQNEYTRFRLDAAANPAEHCLSFRWR